MFRRGKNRRVAGLTVLELMTVLLVLAILLVMAMPLYEHLQSRLERTKCMANLRSLHVAMSLYLQDHRSWPQIANKSADPLTTANTWIGTLQPYNIAQANWICPTIQHNSDSLDMTLPENARIDYVATPFDRNPQTPMRWATQPWFVENADVHGAGNLLIFPDGHIVELIDYLELLKKSTKK